MQLYTALGDSITAGEGATSPRRAYPSLVVANLGRRSSKACCGEVLAEPGWTSEALRAGILDNPLAYLKASQNISVWVGGDDLAYAGLAIAKGAPKRILARTLSQYGRDLGFMVGFLHKVSKARIVVCTQYNPFPNSPLAVSGIAALNQVTLEVGQRMHTVVAPVHEWFAGREAALIAGYTNGRLEDVLKSRSLPIHPNDRGHAVIANGLTPLMAT
ncbi:SGNH/GDSL hydrolase family protein [Alicyclobacillus tolerans]|uniref:SGNH/GDSL hydrolase family protein n=1 Tax=Alicyclobacillus tolerans TaxID=90970 RepID=UPI001F45A23C|nr:SGNH/GDSL hydrolase family protein [Alicyclobacillus tolerans]MCF8566092.1 SGNH/GDSL hydrolase family protein [Alicyclobacillus tolerans]